MKKFLSPFWLYPIITFTLCVLGVLNDGSPEAMIALLIVTAISWLFAGYCLGFEDGKEFL